MTQTLIEAATSYLNAGLNVIALTGKQPNSFFHKHWDVDHLTGAVAPHGDHPADSYTYEGCPGCEDRAMIAKVFTHPTTSGIGLLIPPHLVVVDIDGEAGAHVFREMAGHDPNVWAHTVAAKTGRGLHLWYLTPTPRGSTRLGEKLDLKGVGGYVAAPPSRHPDGHTYEWIVPLVTDAGLASADWLPDGIEQFLVDRSMTEDTPLPRKPKYTIAVKDGKFVSVPAFGNITKLAAKIASEKPGNRNGLLFWAACVARDENVSLEIALRDLGEAAAEAELPRHEVVRTIKSAYRRNR